MKPEDLMVGDWVLIFDKTPVKVDCIGNVEVYLSEPNGQDWRVTYEHIKPIPITPEILEKNGWFYPKQSSWMKLDNPHKELWGCTHTDGTFWLYSSGDCDKDECFAEIKYVHELQRALKVCGIDKTIVL